MTTHLDSLLADTTPISYREFGEMIDRDPQSLRAALARRNRRVRQTGKARESDIPEPSGYRTTRDRRQGTPVRAGNTQANSAMEPWWPANVARRWAMQTGKLQPDGVTPIYYREANAHRARAA
jgi:hypothetical protein